MALPQWQSTVSATYPSRHKDRQGLFGDHRTNYILERVNGPLERPNEEPADFGPRAAKRIVTAISGTPTTTAAAQPAAAAGPRKRCSKKYLGPVFS